MALCSTATVVSSHLSTTTALACTARYFQTRLGLLIISDLDQIRLIFLLSIVSWTLYKDEWLHICKLSAYIYINIKEKSDLLICTSSKHQWIVCDSCICALPVYIKGIISLPTKNLENIKTLYISKLYFDSIIYIVNIHRIGNDFILKINTGCLQMTHSNELIVNI